MGAADFDLRGINCLVMVNASGAALRPARGTIASGKPSEVPPLALNEVREARLVILLSRAGFPAAAYSGALIVGAAAGSVVAAGLVGEGSRPMLICQFLHLTLTTILG